MQKPNGCLKMCNIFTNEVSENGKSLLEELNIDMTKIDYVTEEQVRQSFAQGLSLKKERRQFACEHCDHVWWRTVPVRKMVSKCYDCERKFEALSRDEEYGKGEFECSCGHTFSGFAVMGQTSRCFKCGKHCKPIRIVPPNKRGRRSRRSSKRHSCDGPNCYRRSVVDQPEVEEFEQGAEFHRGGIDHSDKQVTPRGPMVQVETVYDRKMVETSEGKQREDTDNVEQASSLETTTVNTTHDDDTTRGQQNDDMALRAYYSKRAAKTSPNDPKECIHPKSNRKKKVVNASMIHASTGSTVDTFISMQSSRCSITTEMSDIYLRVGKKTHLH